MLYEAPHRLLRTLHELLETLGDREVTITKELTKRHEKVVLTTFSEAVAYYESEEPRGEYVLVIAGKSYEELKQESMKEWEKMSISEHVDYYLSQGFSKKDAMKQAAKDRGCSKRDIYQALLSSDE